MIKQILILLIVLTGFIYSQEAKWVEAEGSCVAANISPEEAMKRAREDARSKAIEMVTGIKVNESQFMKQSEITTEKGARSFEDVFMKMNLSSVSGRIVEEETPQYTSSFEGNYPRYTARIRARVIAVKGEADPDFSARIIMPRDVFYDRGDENKNDMLDFRLWASSDCYFYLFNIMSNDSVQLILPNQYVKDNSYSITKQEQGFEKIMKSIGMKFPVMLPEGKEEASESLFLVAVKEKIDFTSSSLSSDGSGIIPTYKAAMADIMSWLVRIPLDKHTETFAGFEIRKK